jgi:secondary thiamine-phosphate synthase enzyme
MLFSYTLKTEKKGFYDITAKVREAVEQSLLKSGLAVVYCPHTTAAVTINENADPDVAQDLIFALNKTFPDRQEFRHSEGNSAAHLKSSCIGASVTIIVDEGKALLGTWQGVYFCEFDGPRQRKFYVSVN